MILKKFTNQNKSYIAVILGICSLLILSPIIAGLTGTLITQIIFSFVLLSSIFTLTESHRALKFGMWTLFPALIASWVVYIHPLPTIALGALILNVLFISYVIIVLVQSVFFTEKYDWNLILGAICIYFLLGIVWALLYDIIEVIHPHSFRGISVNNSYVAETVVTGKFQELLYYSFVTMSTLGYGDIVPTLPLARNLATIEAIIGQFYIATMVASLVGTLSRQKSIQYQ